ncbi:hypothetical protein CVT24_008610 [Panaeolus cyanescens]|uniref:Protein kinase domain-containing protein n=1 Tax=Panaeolus cyanescens TaxID=181874 RepID=A0A409VBA2_9AGAR|nr:hypothetical protein CVT24_008610 [Panaeolus cyanescens]
MEIQWKPSENASRMSKILPIFADIPGEHPLAAFVARSLQQCATREKVGTARADIYTDANLPSYLLFDDRHISQQYSLRRVVFAPSMVNDLKCFGYTSKELERFTIAYVERESQMHGRPSYGRTVWENRVPDSGRVCEAYQVSAGDMATENDDSKLMIDHTAATDSAFQWITSKTANGPSLSAGTQYTPEDSSDNFWSKYHIPTTSKRKASRSLPKKIREGAIQKVRLPHRVGHRNSTRHSIVPQLLQRAWSRAVEHDATFILLNCGNSERIGIRDRSSNTLFLSDIIDPFALGYGSIHIGLHTAIISDALKRPPPFRETAHIARSVIDPPEHRIPFVSPPVADDEIQARTDPDTFNQEVSKLNILLVSLFFAVYQSEAPSSFLREIASCDPASPEIASPRPKQNKSYPHNECAHFVARQNIGVSDKVTVYRGFITIHPSSGELRQPAILKIAKNANGQKRLFHEYEVYQKLWSSGVAGGILMVHGMFQDIETGVFGLLMQDGGSTLYEREQMRLGVSNPDQCHISEDEFEKLKAVVQAINDVRVQHNDVKPDNICVNAEGDWFLIDFDLALIVTHPDDTIWEDMKNIKDIFKRKFVQELNGPEITTPPPAPSPSYKAFSPLLSLFLSISFIFLALLIRHASTPTIHPKTPTSIPIVTIIITTGITG